MTWNGVRVLVTGAGGFIGSHLVERLTALGARTRALVQYRSDGSWGWLDHSPCKEDVQVVAGDVRDRDSVTQAMQEVEVAFHLAALVAIPYSYHTPAAFVETNIHGTLNVLQAARECKVTRVIHTSTSEVYGTAQYVPIDEAHPLHGQSPYAATKIGADKLAEACHCSYGLPVVTVRPFNTYGPRQSARAIIPTIVTQGLSEGRIRLGNLTPIRDFNYVSDTVEGFLRAAEADDALGRTFNLGSGRGVSIAELVKLIEGLLDRPLTIEPDHQRVRPEESEVERLIAEARAARSLLHWQPSVSLEDGLKMTIEWIHEHLDVYRPGLYAI